MRYILALSAALALVAAGTGCNLISNALTFGYAFDPQEFKPDVGNNPSATFPAVMCAGISPDPCAALAARAPAGWKLSCDTGTGNCSASDTVRLPQQIDLRNAMTPVPSQVVEFGIDKVAIDKINYWLASNTLNVATPPIDVYVAAAGAHDETDPSAVKLGTVAAIPAGSRICGDPRDASDAATGQGQTVCSMPLNAAGEAALGGFIKAYKTAPFTIIVAATVTAQGATPIPSGALDVFVRPSVTFSVLK